MKLATGDSFNFTEVLGDQADEHASPSRADMIQHSAYWHKPADTALLGKVVKKCCVLYFTSKQAASLFRYEIAVW